MKQARKTKKPRELEETSDVSGVFHEGVYVRALPLRSLDDMETIKDEVKSGNIIILRVSPLAKKSVDDVKHAIDDLCEFVRSIGGDIARLGEERVVVTPSLVRIWREKTSTSKAEPSTAA